MHGGTYSLLSRPRIKMRYATPWLAVLLLAVLSVASTEDVPPDSLEEPERTTENSQLTSPVSSNEVGSTDNGIVSSRIRTKKLRQNDDNDVTTNSDVTMDDLLFFESLINGDKIIEENKQNTDSGNKNEKTNIIDSNPENPVESKISTDLIDIRRQGELKPKIKPGKSGPDIQFDDSKEQAVRGSNPRFGQRKLKQNLQDEGPVLQLTQGGYDRPFRYPRFRNRYTSRSDSSEQSTQIQEPDRNSNRQPDARRVIPQVIYTSSLQQPPAFGPRPILSPGFEAPRNMLAVHHVVPTTIQSPFFNTPPSGVTEYATVPFQAQFPQGNEIGGFPNFGRNANNPALYQASQRNPFQTPGVMFQSTPEAQTQTIVIDPSRNVAPQFQPNPFTPFPGYQNAEDNSRPEYAMFFRNPTANGQFQVPPNFYATTPNVVNAFNSQPMNFLSNYPNSEDTLPTRFFRYPTTTDRQNNQQISSDQQPDSDASQEDKKVKVEEKQDAVNPANRNDASTESFGTRLQSQNDVYMRYPTIEAGYATEENLPSQNNSDPAKENNQVVNSEQRNFPITDPFRNGLNLVGPNQRVNNSYDFPREIFRGVPIDFGYQRPQNEIVRNYPDRNREISNYPSPNFEFRRPFVPIASLPENNYQFLDMENQRRGHRKTDGTPSCAKQNNASICFEDSEYPRNDILYSLNSNSFLADRLSGQEMPLNSFVFVERNDNDTDSSSENYVCATDTKYGNPVRAKNLAGAWRFIVNIQGKFSQPVRMEVCRSLGSPCSYVDSKMKTTCVQKYSLQRLLSWMPGRGIHSDIYKIPVACSCQILNTIET